VEVLCAQPVGEVNVEEYPALARLGPRHFSGARSRFQRVRVQAQEVGGFCQVEGAHFLVTVDIRRLVMLASLSTEEAVDLAASEIHLPRAASAHRYRIRTESCF